MDDLYPVYMDTGGERTKVTAYQDINGTRILISSAEIVELPTNCLIFSSAEPFTIATGNSTKNWDGTLYYSTDANTWGEWDGITVIDSARHNGKQRIYMRGSGNSVITGTSHATSYKWVLDGNQIFCNGNIENLLDYETVANGEHPIMKANCFAYLFRDCVNLVTPPELPATKLAAMCYGYLFHNCTSLVTAPVLPATTLASDCYFEMFDSCTSLVTPPELPATTLGAMSYAGMFANCTNLATAPELPATKVSWGGYWRMFWGCTSLVNAPRLPATTLDEVCYWQMFSSCKNLETLPALPATTLKPQCYLEMFYNCPKIKISLTQSEDYSNEYRIPTSGTGKTANEALDSMFLMTGGTYGGTPVIDTTYYTSNKVI